MFWISIAAISAATALVQLGALAVKVAVLKALLAVAVAVALSLGLALVFRGNKGSPLALR
jgi:hypothetical protein